MKTLRGKIVLYISLLIILPSLPLSYFVLQLLDKSYGIGVNARVEAALEGALEISADFYQLHKERVQSMLDGLTRQKNLSESKIKMIIENSLAGAIYQYTSIAELEYTETLIALATIKKYLRENEAYHLWPSPDHQMLYALARLHNNQLLQLTYQLPASFRESASRIQEVNQIYKTLSFARSEIRTSFLYTFLTVYAVGLGITLLVLFHISKRITRPIEQLIYATREIGKGNLSFRLKPKGRDEFALLAASFDLMVQELSENQKKIIELEKMATWQQLARRLAHEIKNPLTPIQLMAQQMRDSYNGDDAAYQKMLTNCYEIIDEEIESLKKLVREFSDFARLPEFHFERQGIYPLLETIQKLYSQVNLRIELPTSDIQIEYDSEYMKRALINLVDNAIAASAPNELIELKVDDDERFVNIAIRDHGSGIAPDDLEKIFEPYFSTKRSGVGLGLSIVKKIIEEHHGQITVTSEIDRGATFTITLPKSLNT